MSTNHWIGEQRLRTLSALVIGGMALAFQSCASSGTARSEASAPRSAPQSVEQVCEDVREAWASGRHAEGDALLARAAKNWPKHVQVGELHAQSLLRQGFARAAEEELKRVVEIDPKCSDAWLALARVRLGLNLVNAAQEAASAAVELTPSQDGYWILARTMRAQHRWTHATLAYEKVIELGADPCAARAEAASMCLESALVRGRPHHIEQWLQMAGQALEQDPNCSAAHRVLARYHAGEGQRELALNHARQVLDLTPSDESMQKLAAELERDPLDTSASL